MKATIISRDANNGRVVELPDGENISIRPLPRPRGAAMDETVPAPVAYTVHTYHIGGERHYLLAPMEWSQAILFGVLVERAAKGFTP